MLPVILYLTLENILSVTVSYTVITVYS